MKGVHATSLKSGLMGVLITETFVDKHALDENFVDLFGERCLRSSTGQRAALLERFWYFN